MMRNNTIWLCMTLLSTQAAGTALADKPASRQPLASLVQSQGIDLSAPLTLDRAVDIAVRNHASVAIAAAQVDAAKARVANNMASYYPQISPGYSYSNQKTSQRVNGQRINGTYEASTTSVNLSETLFDSGKREENVLASRYSARSAQFNAVDTRQGVIQNVIVAYYQLMQDRDLVTVAEASVNRAKTTLDYTTAAVEAGTAARKEILQAQADYMNAQVSLLGARNTAKLAETALKNAMGIITSQTIRISETRPAAPPLEPDPQTSADYVKLAFENRADLQSNAASIDANRHSVKLAQIGAGLQLSASVSEGYRVDPDPGEDRTFSAGVSYPLFDGGAARAAVREAKATLEQARRQLDLTRQSVQSDVEQAYLNREQARLSITATQAALKAAQENYDAALGAQKEGAQSGTVVDVITAQAELVTAEVNAVTAIYDFYINDARLNRGIGKNDTSVAGVKR